MTPLRPPPSPPSAYDVTKHKHTRFWAITRKDTGQLAAVAVYKKGARALASLLDELERLRRIVAGLRLIDDIVEPTTAIRTTRR